MSIIEKIISEKKRIIESSPESFPKKISDIGGLRKTLSLKQAIQSEKFGIIAEIKRASPSAGTLNKDLDVVKTALEYTDAGVSGISVLTCEPFFSGNMADLSAVREACKIPILMKDFIFDARQVLKGRTSGADALLLILRMLSDEDFYLLDDTAETLGMEVLLEIHTMQELERAYSLVKKWDKKILGINNRNLETLKTDLNTSMNLIKSVQKDKITAISESGIKSPSDIYMLQKAGFRGALIGESLLKSGDIKRKLTTLQYKPL